MNSVRRFVKSLKAAFFAATVASISQTFPFYRLCRNAKTGPEKIAKTTKELFIRSGILIRLSRPFARTYLSERSSSTRMYGAAITRAAITTINVLMLLTAGKTSVFLYNGEHLFGIARIRCSQKKLEGNSSFSHDFERGQQMRIKMGHRWRRPLRCFCHDVCIPKSVACPPFLP